MASKRLPSLLARSLRCTELSRPAYYTSTTRIPSRRTSSIRRPHVSISISVRLSSQRPFSTTPQKRKEAPPSKIYDYEQMSSLLSQSTSTSASSSSASEQRETVIIDVREPSELEQTGTIPGAKNIPLKSSPDAFFLGREEFEERFGWARPGGDGSGDGMIEGGEQGAVEVVFFCKAGVRSKAAAELARRAGWSGGGGRVSIGEYPGSWDEWSKRGGQVQKV